VLHSAVHEAHPDIVAMCHAHTVYGTAWAAMGRMLDPITQDAACFYEDHVVIKDEGGAVTVTEDAGKHVRGRVRQQPRGDSPGSRVAHGQPAQHR
jgi:ribulose-5-phosphate 4-epimerase/fuculose-1-phosphate aldolase